MNETKIVKDFAKKQKDEKRYNERLFLVSMVAYISNNYNDIKKELLDLDMYLGYYVTAIIAYGDINSFKNDYNYSCMYNGPVLIKIEEIYRQIQKSLSVKHANNLFCGVNYFNFKVEMDNNTKDRCTAATFLFNCQLNIKGILSNLDRIKRTSSREGKISILKGMIIYY